MTRITKITASIGPASSDKSVLRELIAAGVNVARLNFSHDTGSVQGKKMADIREIARELGRPVAIMADLQGPKHRIGVMKTDDKYPLVAGQNFTLDNNPEPGDATRVQLPDGDVLSALRPGDRVLLNDGKIELTVTAGMACGDQFCAVQTRVVRGNEIWSRRGFNIPNTEITGGVLTPKDRVDLEYALTQNPDFVAISFVQNPRDVTDVRDFITARTDQPVKIIVKIERPQALDNFDEILNATDAVMVARGDLAIEIPFEQIPAIQRKLIRACRKKNKPIIVATQMLASMVDAEFPLRSEISDVATAAYLRADSTMTSEETTIGKNPVGVIETMSKILEYADMDSAENSYDWNRVDNIPENDWSRSVASMAYLNKASAIVVFDRDGAAATAVSCRRPDMPIIAVTNSEITANQLTLSRGVIPIYDIEMFATRNTADAIAMAGIKRGKTVVVDGESITLI